MGLNKPCSLISGLAQEFSHSGGKLGSTLGVKDNEGRIQTNRLWQQYSKPLELGMVTHAVNPYTRIRSAKAIHWAPVWKQNTWTNPLLRPHLTLKEGSIEEATFRVDFYFEGQWSWNTRPKEVWRRRVAWQNFLGRYYMCLPTPRDPMTNKSIEANRAQLGKPWVLLGLLMEVKMTQRQLHYQGVGESSQSGTRSIQHSLQVVQ